MAACESPLVENPILIGSLYPWKQMNPKTHSLADIFQDPLPPLFHHIPPTPSSSSSSQQPEEEEDEVCMEEKKEVDEKEVKMDEKEEDHEQDWGQKVDVVGLCFLDLASNYEPPEELVKWLQAGEKPIYIGFGSLVIASQKRLHNKYKAAEQASGECRGCIWLYVWTRDCRPLTPVIPDGHYFRSNQVHGVVGEENWTL